MLRQVWSDDNHVYAATSSGLDIIEIDSEQRYSYITYSGGFNSVWSNDANVYVATSGTGIKRLPISSISGSIISPYELSSSLTDYANYPTITSDYVRYIHGQSNLLMCCTISGVNTLGVYGKEGQTWTAGAFKCFLAENERLYYTTISGGVHVLNRVNGPWDWVQPDKRYISGGLIFESGISINDIFIYDTTIYAATSNGVYAIDDDTDDYIVYFTGA